MVEHFPPTFQFLGHLDPLFGVPPSPVEYFIQTGFTYDPDICEER